MTGAADWMLLQLADSAFPTGGFAHAGGLEAASQLGRIATSGELEPLLGHSVEQCAWAVLPFVGAAFDRPDDLEALDRHHDATLVNHVANRASRIQGNALLMAAASLSPAISALKLSLRRSSSPMHLPVVAGAVFRILGLARDDARRLFLFQHLRSQVSSAIRLNLVGPLEAQGMLQRVAAHADAALQATAEVGPDDACSVAPLLDCWQGHQDRLYSRLFSS